MNDREFIELIEKNKQVFYRFAMRLCRNRQDAEDLVQEALMKIWQIKGSIDKEQNIISYVFTTIKNKFIDSKRSGNAHLGVININDNDNFSDIDYHHKDENTNIERIIELNELTNIINTIINTLSMNMRLVVQLRDIEGYSTKDTADILDMNIVNVKVNLSRARKQIRNILTQKYKMKNYEN